MAKKSSTKPKTPFEVLKDLVGRQVGKATDVASDAAGTVKALASIPYYNLKADRARAQTDVLKKARKYDDAPNFDSKGRPTEAFKVRSVADRITRRQKAKARRNSKK